MSLPVLGEGQVRGLEDIDDVEDLRKIYVSSVVGTGMLILLVFLIVYV